MNKWVLGARLPTLPASIVPVLVGTATAGGPVDWLRALLAGVVALALQIGCNYANDYSDGIRGTDRERTGPARLVASGLAAPAAVKRAAYLAFATALVAGVILSAATDLRLIVIGAAAVIAAWTYTGGARPYGYRGFGELAVFVFFGLVGTLGSTYVQHGSLTGASLVGSLAVGALATALLVVNNLRDIPTDEASGKRTLAVRLGDSATRDLYVWLVAGSAVGALALAAFHPAALLGLLAFAAAIRPVRAIRAQASGPALIPVLVDTGRLELIFGLLVVVGFVL